MKRIISLILLAAAALTLLAGCAQSVPGVDGVYRIQAGNWTKSRWENASEEDRSLAAGYAVIEIEGHFRDDFPEGLPEAMENESYKADFGKSVEMASGFIDSYFAASPDSTIDGYVAAQIAQFEDLISKHSGEGHDHPAHD